MLAIRLARIGKKNKPYYKLVVQEKTWAPKSKAIELVGAYDPHTNPPTMTLKKERILYWIGKGAQCSETVHNMLVNAKVIDAPKRRVVRGKKKAAAAEEKAEQKKAEVKAETPATEEKK